MANKFGGNRKKVIIGGVVIILALLLIIKSLSDLRVETLDYDSIVTTSPFGSIDKNNSLNHLSKLPTQIDATNNFSDYQVPFYIPKDTSVQINAVGEAADYSTNPFLFKSYDNDGIEVFFDMLNNKSDIFDVSKDDRHYLFLWKSLKIEGQNIKKKGVKVVETDPSPTTYTMELTFPWHSLEYIIPQVNSKFGFDATIMDSDGGSEKGKLSWHSKNDDNWKNTSLYGTIILVEKPKAKMDSNYVLAVKRKKNAFYKQTGSRFATTTPYYKYQNVTKGNVKDSLDLSGKFQAEWDANNLYIKVYVRDNIKSMTRAIFDYGWIEDQNGRMVWKMSMENMRYAGGALKNQRTDTVIRLTKGIYWLKYHTDESHSPSKWDDKPPESSLYGIRIAYKM